MVASKSRKGSSDPQSSSGLYCAPSHSPWIVTESLEFLFSPYAENRVIRLWGLWPGKGYSLTLRWRKLGWSLRMWTLCLDPPPLLSVQPAPFRPQAQAMLGAAATWQERTPAFRAYLRHAVRCGQISGFEQFIRKFLKPGERLDEAFSFKEGGKKTGLIRTGLVKAKRSCPQGVLSDWAGAEQDARLACGAPLPGPGQSWCPGRWRPPPSRRRARSTGQRGTVCK